MRVLIITATIGQGHNAVARSIEAELKQRGVDCRVLDMYRYFSPVLQKIVQGGYIMSIQSVKHTRVIGEKYYDMMEKTYKPLNEHPLARAKNVPMAKALKKYLDKYQPDLVICTQVYCVHIMDIIKGKGWTDAVLMGVDTDFTVQAHWQGNDYLDYMVTASNALNGQLLLKKIPKERILPTGIPISPKFNHREDKAYARECLCLDPNKKTLLVMGGSMGYGNMDKTIQKLDELPLDFQAMVVCGGNVRMRTKLKKLQFQKRFDIYGFSYNIPLMMGAADAMITKPGGISMSEGLAKGLPMILANAIPGMEDRNADFMVEHGLALAVSKTYPIHQAVSDVLGNDPLREKMAENMKDFAHPDSTRVLCDFIVEKAAEHEQKRLEAQPAGHDHSFV